MIQTFQYGSSSFKDKQFQTISNNNNDTNHNENNSSFNKITPINSNVNDR